MNDTISNYSTLPLRRRWMVVDDESTLSELIADVLASLDQVSVENYTSSPDALAAFTSRAGGFDLVVTDRDMPGMNGIELARQLTAQSPSVKVILASANIDDLSISDLQNAGITAVVTKPFSIFRLQATVQSITSNRPPAPALAAAIKIIQNYRRFHADLNFTS